MEVDEQSAESARAMLAVAFDLIGNRSGISYESLNLICHLAPEEDTVELRNKRAYALMWYLREEEVVTYQSADGRAKFAHKDGEIEDKYYWPFDGEYMRIFNSLLEDMDEVAYLPFSSTRRKYGSSTKFDRVLNDMAEVDYLHTSGRGKKKRIYRGNRFPEERA